VITPSVPRVPVGCGGERLGFRPGQPGDGRLAGPLGGDRQDLRDQLGMLGRVQRRMAEERADRGQPGVAGRDAAAPLFFQVGEERADRLGVQVGDLQLVRLASGPGGREGEQQGEGVAVGRDGGGAGLPLDDQLAGEEALQQGGQVVESSVTGNTVLPALPLGLLPRPARRLRADTLLRAGHPRIIAVHRQPPLQLRDPQLQPPFTLPRRLHSRREHRDLRVLRLDHSPQPRDKVTLLANRTRPTGHEPKACSTCTKSSTTSARRRVALRPREWTPGRADAGHES
jgi:hypothetical protein